MFLCSFIHDSSFVDVLILTIQNMSKLKDHNCQLPPADYLLEQEFLGFLVSIPL